MRRLQLSILALSSWFFFFYNIERLSAPINIASFVYVLVAVCSIVVILTPVYRLPLHWIFLGALPVYIYLKAQLGYPFLGVSLPITVTEMVALAITLMLTGNVMKEYAEARDVLANLTMSHLKKGIPFDVGQSLIYREIRRARVSDRSLALLAVAPTEVTLEVSLARFVREAQAEVIKMYAAARLADVLLEEVEDYNIVTQRNGHFLVLLTETDLEEVVQTVNRLQDAAFKKLGLKLAVGQIVFPEEAVTFEQMVTEAEERMERYAANTPPVNVEETEKFAGTKGTKTIIQA